MEVNDVLSCLKEAKIKRRTDYPIVKHSDKAVQFTSKTYYDFIVGIIPSYSKKGNQWDNACIESFHSLIKWEWLNNRKIENWEHAYQLIFEYIEGFYNTVRIHSHCNCLSQNEYEQKYYWATEFFRLSCPKSWHSTKKSTYHFGRCFLYSWDNVTLVEFLNTHLIWN